MKRVHAVFMITVFFLLVFLPMVLPSGTVSAQSTGYSIDKVDHSIEVMYSGQVVVRDTIHVSGSVTDGFPIGLPALYSTDVLKVVAYDSNNVYSVNVGTPLGDQSGFYGVQVNFNGNSPSVFTVAFVLSNSLITDLTGGNYSLNFPAYPSLTQNVASANVTLTLPATSGNLTITKNDGVTNETNYITQNLAAYTYSAATATFQVSPGDFHLTTIDQLTRQINVDPSGKVSAVDSYHMTNNGVLAISSFVFGLPSKATSIVVKDEFGRALATTTSSGNTSDIFLANATMISILSSSQSTSFTINYNLPSATIQSSQFILNNFKLFSYFSYYVEQATITFTPPEGANIVTPQLSSLDSSSTITRSTFQDSLTMTREGISYVDYSSPESNTIQFSYDYNPVWASFRPTFWGALLGAIGCVVAVFYTRRKPSEKEPVMSKAERHISKQKPSAPAQKAEEVQRVTGQAITSENLKEFTDAYEEKKQLNNELKAMDARAQKGKIPRRQYKVQRRAIEIRLETIARNINKVKAALRSSSNYADLVKQLDSAEEDLSDAEQNIRKLETGQSTGEISIETYKKNIGDYQKRRDKAESTINGILLRLREKTR
ncbi:MAG: hypothetical protein ABSA79_08280 [Candidatus Bathyarchaeia archaeon]